MLRLAPPFATSVSFSVGDGKSLAFWNARWAGDFALCNLFPNLHAAARLRHLSVSSSLRRYHIVLDSAFFLHLSWQGHGELHRLRSLLQTVPLSNLDDRPSWRWSGSGVFSTLSAYDFLTFDGVRDDKLSFLWNSKAPLRVKIFLWLAAKNRIMMADTLAKRGWCGLTICGLCNRSAETLEHLLFTCSYSRPLWNNILAGLPIGARLNFWRTGDLTSQWTTLRFKLTDACRKYADTCFAATCWELWKERNDRIFNNKITSNAVLEGRALATANLWISTL